LTAPKPKPIEIPDLRPILKVLAIVTLVVGTGLFYFLGYAFLSVLTIDPALIVVLEDGSWIEVMRWYE